MNTFALKLLMEEVKHGLRYELPPSAESWESAGVNHPTLSVECDLFHLSPSCRLQLELIVISRDVSELAIDLTQLIRRDAPSLFTRYRGYVDELADDGRRVSTSKQKWRHAE